VLHSFTLSFMQQSIKLYAIKKEEKEGWVTAIKAAVGYSSLYDYYTIQVLGKSEYRKRLGRGSSVWCAVRSTSGPGSRWLSRC